MLRQRGRRRRGEDVTSARRSRCCGPREGATDQGRPVPRVSRTPPPTPSRARAQNDNKLHRAAQRSARRRLRLAVFALSVTLLPRRQIAESIFDSNSACSPSCTLARVSRRVGLFRSVLFPDNVLLRARFRRVSCRVAVTWRPAQVPTHPQRGEAFPRVLEV